MSARPGSDQPRFDLLGDILETVRFRGSVFFRSDLAAPWGMSLAPSGIPRFHIALAGSCLLGVQDRGIVEVHEMDIVMLPGGGSHWIADQPGRELVPSEQAAEACDLNNPLFQQGDITNRLICGMVQFDQAVTHPILDSLPEVLHFPHSEATASIWMTVTLLDAELRRTQSSSGSIVDRLTEVLFLQLLEHHVSASTDPAGFLGALRDRRIQQALALIHREPGAAWTLSMLGARVGMSKATLVRHFQETVGVAPMAYLANWRLTKAYNLSKHSSASFERIAETVGFTSARTLSRAFRRRYGRTPSEVRRERGETA